MKKIFIGISICLVCYTGIHSQTTDTITIAGVGDIMQGTNYPSVNYLPPNDGKNLFDPVRSILKSADLTFGNSEGTFLDSTGNVKKCSDPSVCYAFRQPERYAKYLSEAGFDLMSIANNHVGDFGEPGRRGSKRAFDAAGLKYAGLKSVPYVIFEKGGIKYGFCAFAPNNGTMQITDIDSAKNIVAFLNKQVDIVIVSFHGGAEGETKDHVTRGTEIYLGENRGNVHLFAHSVIDVGADIVFGHGPHVTRGAEIYNDRFIAYSMGNFCTYGRFSLKGKCGHSPIILVDVDKNGKFLGGKIVATKQVGEGGPVLDPENSVITEMINLSTADFPESKLVIEKNGTMRIK